MLPVGGGQSPGCLLPTWPAPSSEAGSQEARRSRGSGPGTSPHSIRGTETGKGVLGSQGVAVGRWLPHSGLSHPSPCADHQAHWLQLCRDQDQPLDLPGVSSLGPPAPLTWGSSSPEVTLRVPQMGLLDPSSISSALGPPDLAPPHPLLQEGWAPDPYLMGPSQRPGGWPGGQDRPLRGGDIGPEPRRTQRSWRGLGQCPGSKNVLLLRTYFYWGILLMWMGHSLGQMTRF